MIPDRFEYLFVLTLFLLLIASLFPKQLSQLLTKRLHWLLQGVFLLFATMIDILAIHAGWWTFNVHKMAGIYVFGLPIEEYILFVLYYTATCAAWEALTHDLA